MCVSCFKNSYLLYLIMHFIHLIVVFFSCIFIYLVLFLFCLFLFFVFFVFLLFVL